MQGREAIERLKYHFAHHDDGRPTPYLDEAAAMAINALEKQIPKHAVYSDLREDDDGEKLIPHRAECPTCGYSFEFGTWNDEENHHCVCGQSMKWSGHWYEV